MITSKRAATIVFLLLMGCLTMGACAGNSQATRLRGAEVPEEEAQHNETSATSTPPAPSTDAPPTSVSTITPASSIAASTSPSPTTEHPSHGCLNDVDATGLLQTEGKPDNYRAMAVIDVDCRDDWAVGSLDDGKDEGAGIVVFRRTSNTWRFLYGAWSPRAVCDVAFQEAAPEWVRSSLECFGEPTYVREGGGGAKYGAFRTPSRNILCNLSATFANCTVEDNTWDLPAEPQDCLVEALDWGSSVQFMDDQSADLICRGDAPEEGPVLPYGHSVEVGPISCLSEEDGVTCTNSDTGHGFKVNRASYDLF